MNNELLDGIIETMEQQSNTIKELFEICELLKDKIESLEKEIK